MSVWLGFRVCLPPALVAACIATHRLAPWLELTLLAAALAASAWLAVGLEARAAQRARTLSAVLTAYREGDFSVRARSERAGTAFGDVLTELNDFGDALRKHRLGELEAWLLLEKVVAGINAVVIALDELGRVKLANAEAARMLGKPAQALVLEQASRLGLSELLEGSPARTLKRVRALAKGPWELRRGTFRMSGQAHTLLVLSDVSCALREEERETWKRLIRVMAHEINNSLAPIQSVADNVRGVIANPDPPEDWREDVHRGLSIVARRAEGLARFIAAYSKLARLPPPQLGRVVVHEWVERVSALERRVAVDVPGGPSCSIAGDLSQLEQLLINLLKNAAEASLERGGAVRVHWAMSTPLLVLCVDDDGPGIADTCNLFVPFFTTKPGGSGIGLVLAREIAEAHGGALVLDTRPDGTGARAVLSLPLDTPPPAGRLSA